jgi:hypothetical protein
MVISLAGCMLLSAVLAGPGMPSSPPLEFAFKRFCGPPPGHKGAYDAATGTFHVHFRKGKLAETIGRAHAFEITKVAGRFDRPVVFRLEGVPASPNRPLALTVGEKVYRLAPERHDKELLRVERKQGVTLITFTPKGQALLRPGARVSYVRFYW